jgi:hypothetical protein
MINDLMDNLESAQLQASQFQSVHDQGSTDFLSRRAHFGWRSPSRVISRFSRDEGLFRALHGRVCRLLSLEIYRRLNRRSEAKNALKNVALQYVHGSHGTVFGAAQIPRRPRGGTGSGACTLGSF